MGSTAASRSKAATWGYGDKVQNANFETVESNAAKSVQRTNTNSGYKHIPLVPIASEVGGNSGLACTLGGWVYTEGTSSVSWILFSLGDLPHNHTFTSVIARLEPTATHAGEPWQLPYLKVIRTTTNGTAAVIGSAQYSWISTASYEGSGVTLSAVVATASRNIDASEYTYSVLLGTETGTNALSCYINSIRANVTVDTSSGSAGGPDFTFWV